MTEQQITGEQATAQLAEKLNNPEWRTAWLAGNGPQRKEFEKLTAAKNADAATADARLEKIVAGTAEIPFMETTTAGQISTLAAIDMAASLQEAGLTAEQTRQAMGGKPVEKKEYDAVMLMRSDLVGSSEWRAKLLAGDAQARRQMLLFSTVKANGFINQERTQ